VINLLDLTYWLNTLRIGEIQRHRSGSVSMYVEGESFRRRPESGKTSFVSELESSGKLRESTEKWEGECLVASFQNRRAKYKKE